MVDVGFTVVDPTRVELENDPGVIATDDAFVTLKERVEVPAEATIVADATKETMAGALPFKTVTVIAEEVATFASASVVDAVRMCDPFEAPVVSQETWYGGDETSGPSGLPSRKKRTEAMPAVDVGFAVTVTVDETVAPFVGVVSETETPVEDIVSVTGTVFGDPEAFGSDIVAVALWVPRDCPVGFTMKRNEVEAFDPSELEAGAKVSQDWVEVADQVSVEDAGPEFWTATPWEEVAVAPWDAVKESEVEVVTERMAGFTTFTTIEAEEVLFDASCASAMRVDDPSDAAVVFQETKY